MKKILLVAVIGVFTLASCKKDYTCVCKDSTNTYGTYTIKTTKKKSKDLCAENEATWKTNYPNTTCTIQ